MLISVRRLPLCIALLALALGASPVLAAPSCVTKAATTICLAAPLSGATLTGSVVVTATTSGASASRYVSFWLDSEYGLTDHRADPYGFRLDTRRYPDGPHTVSVRLMGTADPTDPPIARVDVPVTFANGVVIPPPVPAGFLPRTATPSAPGAPLVVAAVGDGPDGEADASQVAGLLASFAPDLVLFLGDVYGGASTSEFANWYGEPGQTLFGRFHAITNPVIGNRDYLADRWSGRTAGLEGYNRYWASPPEWYSVDAGSWHLIALSTDCPANSDCSVGSPQHRWLAADLAANTRPCTLAFQHHPRLAFNRSGGTSAIGPLFDLLVAADVDLDLAAHEHSYQRFAPTGPALTETIGPAGTTSFIVGTGGHGATLTPPSPPFEPETVRAQALLRALQLGTYGALKLLLYDDRAEYAFTRVDGTVLDAGTVGCHGLAPTLTERPYFRPGRPTAGTTARCVVPAVEGRPAASLRYQWLIDRKVLPRARRNTLRPIKRMRGRVIQCRAIARNRYGETARLSTPRRVR